MDAAAGKLSLSTERFRDPDWTADGEPRASVAFAGLETLWFNTGTLCNLECRNCYIESSPGNDRLVYMGASEVARYLDEIETLGWPLREIGFTGGEPFMNPEFIAMVDLCLGRGFAVLVLTNAMRPMHKVRDGLLALRDKHGAEGLTIRVSIDHYSRQIHEQERGPRSWRPMIDGLLWLAANGFTVRVAGRTFAHQTETAIRAGYAHLFAGLGLPLDASDPAHLVLFPEMTADADVPEITTQCWDVLGVDPARMMCATSRMVIRRKGAARAVVVPCTLLPEGAEFEMGATLAGAAAAVKLNHPHCASFCVLGGGSCSVADQIENP